MNGNSFTPQEQELIERLGRAPQPELDSDIFENIRAQMLAAMDIPYPTGGEVAPRTFPVSAPVVIGIVAFVVIIVTVILIAIGTQPTPEQPIAAPTRTVAPSATTEPTITPLTPTATPTATETPSPATVTAVEAVVSTATHIPTETSTLTATSILTTTTTPTVLSAGVTPTLQTVIVVEGPVQNINVNVITIYNIDITLDAGDPLLTVIQIGDVIHIDATYETSTTVIVAVNVVFVTTEANDDIAVNPDTGESWRDNGNCDNPPPPWAPANGWRRRCEGGSPPGNSGNNNNNGNGMGRGDDDDDD